MSCIVMRSGGTTIASAHNTRMGRFLQLREVCIMAMMGKREDVLEIPQDWISKQPVAMAEAPALVGAALHMFANSDATSPPSLVHIGVIGLFGIDADPAVTLMTSVMRAHKIFATPGL